MQIIDAGKLGVRIPKPGLTLYRRDNGDDAKDGLSPETAVRSLGQLIHNLRYYDCAGDETYLDLGSGRIDTKGIKITRSPTVGHGILILQGQSPNETVLYTSKGGSTLSAYHCDIRVANLTVEGGIYISEQAFFATMGEDGPTVFKCVDDTLSLFVVRRGGFIWLYGDPTFSGTRFRSFIQVDYGGVAQVESSIIIADNPTCSVAGFVTHAGGISFDGRFPITGNFTGKKYRIITNLGGISVNGKALETFIPGTIAGTTEK